jgi:DNA mismatch endonuclease (patch repair protein)
MTSRRRKSEVETIDPARSALMARVRQRNSAPELVVRGILRKLGISYRTQAKRLPGTPDIYLPAHNRAIFVHGCFWHRHEGCFKTSTPKARRSFWITKFDENVARDARNVAALKKLGLKVTVVWECQCKDTRRLASRLKALLSSATEPKRVWRR